MAWSTLPLVAVAMLAVPQLVGLLIVALVPDRAQYVCQVLREGSCIGCLVASLRHSHERECGCTSGVCHARASKGDSR